MIELVYASAATVEFSPEDLAALLVLARSRNEENGVTGVLFHHQGSFMQVLEGEPDIVRATFERIGKDRRHGNVLLLKQGEIEKRSFAEWRMGFISPSPELTSLLAGFSDFLRGGTAGLQGNAVGVANILNAFRDGRYRRAIR